MECRHWLLVPCIFLALGVGRCTQQEHDTGSNTRRLTGGAFSGASKGSARLPLSMSDVAEQFLADYYAGCVKLPASDANIVVTSSVSAHQYPWAKPEWGQYKQRAVVEADPTGKGPGLTVWAWDIVPEAAVQQTLVVLRAMLAELNSGARMRLLTSSPPGKLALFKRPEQVWTDVPEHSIFKNTSSSSTYEFSGVGGTKEIPVSSCDSRNVLETADDVYTKESVLVHEFAHHVHIVGLSECVYNATVAAYKHSVTRSAAYTSSIYMASNVFEYIAIATQAWFQATTRSDVNDGIIDRPRLFARDPTLFNLFQNIFTPSVKRFDYKSVCLNCTSKWWPAATVPLINTAPAAPLINLTLESCAPAANSWNPVAYSAPDCADTTTNCSARAISSQCDSAPDMLAGCQRSCGLCRLVSSRPKCFDRDPSCFVAANIQGKCQSDAAGMGPQGLSCLVSCGTCRAAPTSPSPNPSTQECGTCASKLCTASQGCCLRPAGNTCRCNSTLGMEPAKAAAASAQGDAKPYCGWALRMESDKYTLPGGAVVALPYKLVRSKDEPWPHALSSVCPPRGRRVFRGRRHENPLGVSLVLQRMAQSSCPGDASSAAAAGFVRLGEVRNAALGEGCREWGSSRLVFNVTLALDASAGSCLRAVLQLTDGSRRRLTFKII